MAILKKNKVYVPDASGAKSIEYIRKLKVDKSSCLFSATVPDHLLAISALVCDSGDSTKIINYRNDEQFFGEVVEKTAEATLQDWDSLIHRCSQFIVSSKKEKVILFDTEMNVYILDVDNKRVKLNRKDVHFAECSPLVGLNYKVCYRVGDRLVDEDNKYVGSGSDRSTVIPYTEERELFLEKMANSLKSAAFRLHEFSNAINESPESIDLIMNNTLVLE